MARQPSSLFSKDFASGLFQIVALAGVACVAFVLSGAMRVSTETDTNMSEGVALPPIVMLGHAELTEFAPVIKLNGVVEANVASPISPQVGGRVDWVSNKFQSGKAVKSGDLLFTIDTDDFDLQYRLALGELGSAQAALANEEAEAELAIEQWEALFPGEPISALTARGPQLDAARARLESAKAARDQAELAIKRAKVRAPSDGRLISAGVTLGQVVNANQSVGSLYAFDAIELALSLPEEQLQLLSPVIGRTAQIPERPGLGAVIDRVEGTLDARTRMLTLRASLNAPKDLRPGQFFEAQIQAPSLGELLKLDAAYIRFDDTIWIARAGKAFPMKVEVIVRDGEYAYITPIDLADGIIIDPPFGLKAGDPIRPGSVSELASSELTSFESAR